MNRTRCSISILAAVAGILCAAGDPQLTWAQPADAVESGRDALVRDAGSYPWYDQSKDDVRRVDVVRKKSNPNDNRDSDWETNPNAVSPWQFSGFGYLSVLLRVLLWVLIFAVFFALIGLVVWVFLKMERKQVAELDADRFEPSESDTDAERVENLPFKVKKPLGDLLSEARRNYEAGNYRDAVIYLFSHMLVELDKHQFIRLAKGKTNRQYMRELGAQRTVSGLLQNTMLAFEDVFFGDHELQRREFEICWRGLDEFHGQVRQGERS